MRKTRNENPNLGYITGFTLPFPTLRSIPTECTQTKNPPEALPQPDPNHLEPPNPTENRWSQIKVGSDDDYVEAFSYIKKKLYIRR